MVIQYTVVESWFNSQQRRFAPLPFSYLVCYIKSSERRGRQSLLREIGHHTVRRKKISMKHSLKCQKTPSMSINCNLNFPSIFISVHDCTLHRHHHQNNFTADIFVLMNYHACHTLVLKNSPSVAV